MTDSPSSTPLDVPFFQPVPTRDRHDGWTAERQERFLAALLALGTVAGAARAVGLSSASAYKLRRRADAASFAEAWDIALMMGRDHVWEQAMDRAVNGYTRPIRYRGRVIGHRHVFNDRLAYALAYGERMANPIATLNQSLSRVASSTSADDDAAAPVRSRR
jgi:hypothetical protein